MLSPEGVSDLYSRLPQLRRLPSTIFVTSGKITTEGSPYSEASPLHRFNAELRKSTAQFDDPWEVRGLHQAGSPAVVVSEAAPPSTYVHEASHLNNPVRPGQDFPNEYLTRLRTKGLMKFALYSPLRRPVKYVAQPMAPEEMARFIEHYHMTPLTSQDTVQKYVLVPAVEHDWFYRNPAVQYDWAYER